MSARARFALVAAILVVLGAVFFVVVRGFSGEAPEEGAAPEETVGGNPLAEGLEGAPAGSDAVEAPPEEPIEAEPVEEPAGEPTTAPEPPSDPSGEGPPVAAGDSGTPPHDPLGRLEEGAAAGVASGARLAASNYVTYAYGYTGSDREQYEEGVSKAVVRGPEFYRTDGGAAIQRTAELIEREGGVRSAAKLDDFRALEGKAEDEGIVRARISFSVGEGWAPTDQWEGGEPTLSGEVVDFEQEVYMTPAGGRSESWKIFQAGPVRVAAS